MGSCGDYGKHCTEFKEDFSLKTIGHQGSLTNLAASIFCILNGSKV